MNNTTTFELKREHVELLKHACWTESGNEYDTPCIDSKYPFGYSSLYPSMIEILDNSSEKCMHCGERISRKYSEEALIKLFDELQTALSVILTSQSFVLGKYIYNETRRVWIMEELCH